MRILIAGVNYAPEATGIGPYTTGLAEHLALQGHDVVVATTFPFAPLWRWFEPPPRWRTHQRINGVEVWRTKILLPPRRTAAWRIVFDCSVGMSSALTALSIRQVDIAICVSPPIQTTLAAAAVRFKLGKLVILVKDLPTEAARSVGMLDHGVALRAGRILEHFAYKLADHIVVISGAFAKYIQNAGVDASKVSVIPDWADVESIRPAQPDPEMRQRLGANQEDFLVLHTGNMGAKQDLLNVVDTAALLRENIHIKFALVGDGQERNKIAERIASKKLDNIKVLPLQESKEFPTVLTAADVLLINQAPLIVDSVLPSKLLAYMASGRPVLAAAHSASTTANLIRSAGCGLVAAPGRPDVLARALSSMVTNNGESDHLTTMGLRGRAYVKKHYDRRALLDQWVQLLVSLSGKQQAASQIDVAPSPGRSDPD